MLTVALAVKHPKGIKDWKSNFGLNGYYADFFSIGHTSGVITVATTVRARLYSFDVTAFITGTYANGRSFTNFTEVDVSVFVHGEFFSPVGTSLSIPSSASVSPPLLPLPSLMALPVFLPPSSSLALSLYSISHSLFSSCSHCDILSLLLDSDGAYFKDTNYPLSVAADLPKQSQILNLEKELNYDRSSVQEIRDFQFTRT